MIEWRDLKGFEGFYEISEYGDIKNTKTGKLRKIKPNIHGYMEVDLYKNGKVFYKKVHRLVAETFLNAPDNSEEFIVMHLDNDKTNNHYTNLKWGTVSENTKQAYDDGLIDIPDRSIPCELILNEFISIDFDNISKLSEYVGINDSTISYYINNNRPIKKGKYGGCYVKKNI